VPRGKIDALSCESSLLGRSHPVFVYHPHGYDLSKRQYPSLYVLDGGDYLSLGMMATVLDNMIADQRICPIVAVFVEPRTDITRPRTNKRTKDYTMSDAFVGFLTRELLPLIERRYRVSGSARERGIMGTSLGGLLATYAAYTQPGTFALSAAQSPSYWWNKRAMITTIARGPVKPVRFYLDTGTYQDNGETARAMRDVFDKKGYRYSFGEYPEGHNWGSWRARIPKILEYFWGRA
jgi:enterochelin esterase family protein